MKRNSSKESLNDYFWDDLDETSGRQIEESFISLLTKSKVKADNDNNLQAEDANDAVTSQGLIHRQDNATSEVYPVQASSEVKSGDNMLAEMPNSHFDSSPVLSCKVSVDNERVAPMPDKASMNEPLYGDETSSREEPTPEFTDLFAQENVTAKQKERAHTSSLSSVKNEDDKAAGHFEDNNELPNSFWGNGEDDGTDIETKLSLLTLNAKSEKGSEYSSLFSKFSTEVFLCSTSEVSRNTESVLNAAGAKKTKPNHPSTFEDKSSVSMATLDAQNITEKRAIGEKIAVENANEETHEDIVGSTKKAADVKHRKKEVHKELDGEETLIPKHGGRELVSDDAGFNFREYPRILYLQGRLLVAHPTKQKRFDVKSVTEREFVSTLFSFYILNYHLPSIVDLNCSSIVEDEPMLSVLFSGDLTINQIISVLGLGKIKYVVSDIEGSKGDANELVEMFFLNREIAIRHALTSRQWALALFLSHNTRHQEEVTREFSRHLNPILHPFFGCGEMSDNWKQTFSLLLRNPQSHLIDMLLSSIHGMELLFAVLSFYFVHSRQFNSRCFFNNFCFLKLALRYGVEPEDMDLLILRYLRVMQEEGKDDTSKVYNKYKGRKGVIQWEPKKSWLEGIRSVVEKGISRIVGVDEDIVQQGDSRENTLQGQRDNQTTGSKQSLGYRHCEHRSVPPNKHESDKDQAGHASDRKQNKITYAHERKQETKHLQEVETATRAADITGHLYCKDTLPTTDARVEGQRLEPTAGSEALQDSTVINDEGAQNSSGSQKTHSGSDINSKQHVPNTWSSVYGNEERSQSCADLSSLLPADILQEGKASEKNGEEKPGFFSRFNLFSKKKTYRVNLSSKEDFKYDPATKKWTSSTSTCDRSLSPVPIKKETSKPAMINMKKINVALDGSIKSRYTNNVNVEGERGSLASLLPKKK